MGLNSSWQGRGHWFESSKAHKRSPAGIGKAFLMPRISIRSAFRNCLAGQEIIREAYTSKRSRYSIIHQEFILQSLNFQEYPDKQRRYFFRLLL